MNPSRSTAKAVIFTTYEMSSECSNPPSAIVPMQGPRPPIPHDFDWKWKREREGEVDRNRIIGNVINGI